MSHKIYDYLIVGSGLFGSIFAHELKKMGKKILVIERRNHIGGNIYSENKSGIDVHRYGPHIFHTNKKMIWDYVNSFTPFRQFIYSPIANYKGKLFNLPFNMHTFYQMWGVRTPLEAMAKIESQRTAYKDITPTNLEQQALRLVGKDIYEKLIQGYTEKQWGRLATDLPAFIIQRLPIRLTFDNNYFNDLYQGIPEQGYTRLISRLLEGVEVITDVDFLESKEEWQEKATKVVYTGRIDAYFGECLGKLEYRSLRFEDEYLETGNYQGVAVMNYTEREIQFTRITEHKHFLKADTVYTIVTREYPQAWSTQMEPYYPINDARNNRLYQQYLQKTHLLENVIFGGRLGEYRYYNMDQVIELALASAAKEIKTLQ